MILGFPLCRANQKIHRVSASRSREIREILISGCFLFVAEFSAVGLGAQVALYCLSLHADWNHLFVLDVGGFVQRDLMEAIIAARSRLIPTLGWLVDFGKFFGATEQETLFTALGRAA